MSAERVVIHGKVQGVWYRAWTVEQATRRGLSGWVRNRYDGTVEALFAGAPAAVEAMIEACQDGPRHARVSQVERFPADAPEKSGFYQLPDGD
jgi:acylphosphatase